MDELNRLSNLLTIWFQQWNETGRKTTEEDIDSIIDSIADLLLLSYLNGHDDTQKELGTKTEAQDEKLTNKIFNRYPDGKDFTDRIREHLASGKTAEEIQAAVIKVADTEMHRMYNAGGYDAAMESGIDGLMKRWVTMKDERVRDTHISLEGVKIPMEELFYAIDGDSADFPGDFMNAENNVNCRCYLSYTAE